MDTTNSIYTWLESQGPEGALVLAELRRLRDENATIRRRWCVAYAGFGAYMDDGEAHDCREHPFIDFKRDGIDEIAKKMGERAMSARSTP